MTKLLWAVCKDGAIYHAPVDFIDNYDFVHFKRDTNGKRIPPVARSRTHTTLRAAIEQRLADTKEVHSRLTDALAFLESLNSDTKRRKAFKDGKLST